MIEYLKSRVSRAQMLKTVGIGAIAAVGAPTVAGAAGYGSAPSISFPFFPQVQGRYTPENLGDIISIADTAEHLAVTFLTAGLQNAAKIGLSGLVLAQVQAILAEEVAHIQFLEAAGAKSLTDSFTVPDPKMLSDYTTFFATLETADTIFNAAYMAATREFAELGQPLLAKIAYQIGSVEAEHRAIARAALALHGDTSRIPPANKAFETDLFLYVRDAAAVLKDLGFLGGSGTPATYPGIATALSAAGAIGAGVTQLQPNNATTSITARDNITGERK